MIKTEKEYQEKLKRIEELEKLNFEEYSIKEEELQNLIFEIMEYEEKHCKLPEPTLKDKLQFAQEQFGLEIKVEMKGYKSIIKHSVELDSCYHGKLIGIDDLIIFEGETIDEVCDAFVDAVHDYIELKKEK